MKKSVFFFWLFILVLLCLTRFIGLDWGSPYFFHPDERNIASSISQLSFPSQLNPHFFAYGSLPIYLIFILGLLFNTISSCYESLTSCQATTVSFDQAILLGRFISALLSCLSVLLMYRISTLLWSKTSADVVLFLGIFCTGFIQFSHFGTFEMWTVFFSLLLCLFCIQYVTQPKTRGAFLISLITGLLVSIKISNAIFIPLSFVFLTFPDLKTFYKQKTFSNAAKLVLTTILFIGTIILTYLVTNPFALIANTEFLGSIIYEKNVAAGIISVFYTQEFFMTIPVLYQLLHVFPFLINPVLTVLIPLVFIALFSSLRKHKRQTVVIVFLFFLTGFLSQAILFTKWTRYVVTSIPFLFLLFPSIWETLLYKRRTARLLLLILILSTSIIFSTSYTLLVFGMNDTREEAAAFAKKHIPQNSQIISEVYDLGIVPFNANFPNIKLINTYDVERDLLLLNEAQAAINNAEYIIIPSQRVSKTRLADPTRYPKGHAIYSSFQSAPYQKIFETPCNMLCQIVYLGDQKYRFEQTAHVFDRPTVIIYKKQ